MAKIDAILQSKSDSSNSIFEEYVSNEGFIKLLGINKHTAVNYRNKGMITYYRLKEKSTISVLT